ESIPDAPRFLLRQADGGMVEQPAPSEGWPPGHPAALECLLDWLQRRLDGPLTAVGHRVVHGGQHYAEPVRIDTTVLAELSALVPLAPLHQPHNLAPIRQLAEQHPELPQVACFDTAFHRSLPPLARRFGLPHALHQAGVQRYGFHGLSYEYLSQALQTVDPVAANGRCVLLHLGNGASLCATRAGSSVHTSMGFSALDGLIMGTRCGRLDPGVVLHLQRQGMSADEIEALLYRQSGLLGVSGIASDMRTLLASEAPAALEAVALYCQQIQLELGMAVAALGGLDAIVFSAGVGEHAAPIRAAVLEGAGWLGVQLDPAANARHGPRLTLAESPVRAWVIPTDEEGMIARHTRRLVL
ncbi:MAG: acetate/propionate family kinase, partial [Xanthomonadales bacterium]|nr:acetate/propionate family kinase [Xanthomonadales bacterium]